MSPGPRPSLAAITSMALASVLFVVGSGRLSAATDTAVPERIDALIAGLGDDDYHRREAAAAELKALGPTAIDALLAAAETNGDLEVALRARWLVEAIPFEMPHDPPEVVKLLARFKRRDFADRAQAMHRLLRVDDDGGIEALARVVRLDPSPAGSRVAAALLAREWRMDDPAWPDVRRRIEAGLGPSTRPAARFLSALVRLTGEATRDDQAACLHEAGAALLDLGPDGTAGGEDPDGESFVRNTHPIFARCRAEMLLSAGRRDDALAAAQAMLTARTIADEDLDEASVECADTLVWAVEAGLPDAVEPLLAEPATSGSRLLLRHAIALAERARGHDREAEEWFAATSATAAKTGYPERLQAAILLVKWGCFDWATRAYDALVGAPEAPAVETALASIMYAEFLHDLERDDEAARCLERIFAAEEPTEGQRRPDRGPLLEQIGRDSRVVRARMHFFTACAAAQRGDAAGQLAALTRALDVYPKDVDALIALYALSDNSPEQRTDAVRRIKAALARLEEEIQAVPDDPNGYNEYAWLVANTEGDLEKATRYSKLSLVKSFDSASYLDTLAHCRAARGQYAAAVRTQRLARRQEPHNRTIQRNLERFEALAR